MPEEERQYISSEAECRETTITDGFVLIACDGIWDEIADATALRCAKNGDRDGAALRAVRP